MKEVKKKRLIPLLMFIFGILLIILSTFPIVEYEIHARKRYPKLISPINDEQRTGIFLSAWKDFDRLANWSSEYELKSPDNYAKIYRLSIPKLRINDAYVYEGGEDLSEGLIQYPGTAVPGEIGNTVIFGHSVLPIFYNPKNYSSIFSTIPRLTEGDEIFVKIDGLEYKYKVDRMFEVEPDNLDILDQRSNDSYISLVTCVPPGHPLKPRRLVVRGRIVE